MFARCMLMPLCSLHVYEGGGPPGPKRTTNLYTNRAKRNLFVCLHVCPEWAAMPYMEWLPASGIQG